MTRLAADENFNNAVLRGLRLRRPFLDVVRVQDVGLSGRGDSIILRWTAEERRVLLTHDAATVPLRAFERLQAGHTMSGVCVVPRGAPLAAVFDDGLLIAECSDEAEWLGVGGERFQAMEVRANVAPAERRDGLERHASSSGHSFAKSSQSSE